MGILANENAISGGNYQIANSLRFQSASSQYLSRTPATASNRKTWTLSCWVKRGTLSADGWILGCGTTAAEYTGLVFNGTTNALQMNVVTASTNRIVVATQAVFRDPSAWYHIVLAVDTTQATNSNGVKIYINGVQQTLTFTTYTQNIDTAVNNTVVQELGRVIGLQYLDGYMAEVNFIDGQALTPSSFGTTDLTSGQWVAKPYAGTYGTNGFELQFANGTSTTTLGADSSGNSNNWTLTNFTRSAGVSDCWMYDVPSGNGGVSGTQPNSNYAVMNPNYVPSTQSKATVINGNLDAGNAGTNTSVSCAATMAMTSGKYYWEVTIGGSFNWSSLGMQTITETAWRGSGTVLYRSDGNKVIGGTATAYGASYTTNDVLGFAYDADAGTLTCYKNNTSQGTIYSSGAGNSWLPAMHNDNAGAGVTYYHKHNFGQRSFAYTPPSGYKALCTANLPVATIKQGNKYMDATLYTGTGASLAVTNTGAFQPDFVWVKGRSGATDHALYDAVRGTTKDLVSNSTAAETTQATGLTAFNTSGFTVGALAKMNTNTATYVGWQWQAGQGSTSSNTNGSITSTVSVNATAGFSVVTYTGTGANATVGHGLGVAPKMIIVKKRNAASTWLVWQSSLTTPTTAYLSLEATNAQGNTATVWNSTLPTSTAFSVGTDTSTNASAATYVAYCFAEIAGFSKFGSYTGNGSTDGPFVYLGFRPKFILLKNTVSGVDSWSIRDSSRNPSNAAVSGLYPNLANAEGTDTAVDFLSNGFKIRGTSGGENGNGQNIIYMAFAENPFAQANAR
jgi:hypothetical protein